MGELMIQIGELSDRTGCNIETIRYYERIGVMAEPRRRGRYRSYGPEDIARLSFIRRARELGFTLDEIRALLDLASGGKASCAQARDLAASHLKNVRARISDLKRMERALAQTVQACETGSDAGCPLMVALQGDTVFNDFKG
ncbi:MAG TPA: helix-turn-helix domain-containing protein [Rhizomicrobium sp.]|nr:helix-turn-helix domain-containing protein [Rhizomicrobium sp.]